MNKVYNSTVIIQNQPRLYARIYFSEQDNTLAALSKQCFGTEISVCNIHWFS